MKIIKQITLEQAAWKAVERDWAGFNSATQAHGTFYTAVEHGCRPLNCTAHWRKFPLPPKVMTVEVWFDEQVVAQTLATTAARNKTGRATEYGGLLKAKVRR